MSNFTREQLETMTRDEVRKICTHQLKIVGMSKKTKGECISTILSHTNTSQVTKNVQQAPAAPVKQEELRGIEFNAQSTLTKPNAKTGDKTTTTIHVSCGASSGAFPVAGKSVFQVGEFLREVLNVDSLSTGIVNGKTVESSYTLREGDRLEFLKPAGRKG